MLRKRLWQIGFAAAVFIATAVAMNFTQGGERSVSRKSAGHDFLAFYTAGTFVRTGRSHQLYDLPAIKTFEREVIAREGLELRGDDAFGPYWNPPLFAWVFAPLSRLSYQTAWLVWTGVNLLCLAGALTILARIIARDDACVPSDRGVNLERAALLETIQRPVDWRTWGLVPLLILVSMPLIQALGHGQNTCVSLLILSATVALWRNRRGAAAGMVAGLLFYKPQLAAVVAIALVLSTGWRALAGLLITGVTMVAATELTLAGTIADFLHRFPGNLAFMQVEHRYLWERHVTLKAFWRLMLQGYATGEFTPITKSLYYASLAVVVACLFAAVWKLRRQADQISTDRFIALTIVCMPLLMPFYFDYDLLLLSAAAVLVAREHLTSGERIGWAELLGWAALYGWTIFNPAVAARTHVNGTVLIVTFLAGTMLRRALRRQGADLAGATMAAELAQLRHAA